MMMLSLSCVVAVVRIIAEKQLRPASFGYAELTTLTEIQKIIVPALNQLKFIFHNGTMKTVKWQDHSRSESWTDEMRKQAGQITKERRWHQCP